MRLLIGGLAASACHLALVVVLAAFAPPSQEGARRTTELELVEVSVTAEDRGPEGSGRREGHADVRGRGIGPVVRGSARALPPPHLGVPSGARATATRAQII